MSFSICGTTGKNTGKIACDRRRGIPKKIIIGGYAFDSSEYASQTAFDAALLAAFKLATGDGDKLYPFPEITGVSDKTEATKESTLGSFGPKVTLIEGRYAVEFDVLSAGVQEKSLRHFNGQNVPVFIVDDSNAVWGKSDTAGNFTGCDALIHTTPHKFGDGSNGQTTKVSISFVSAADTYDSAAFVATNLSLSDMEGLLDADLTYISNSTNVYKIGVYIPTGGVGVKLDMYDNFPDDLAVAGLWLAKTGATFASSLAITSVAKDTSLHCWTITFDSTAYGLLASGAKIKLSLVAPTALDAGSVVGIEGVAVILTK